jgi:predicted Zn-dependent peptidase
MYELLGDANRINDENRIYSKITTRDILKCANEILQKTNCSVLKVKADKNAR